MLVFICNIVKQLFTIIISLYRFLKYIYIFIYLFIYLAVPGLNCGMWDL